ncbi:MAG: flagellar protein export ATPase FliI, fliI [Chlamydiales bacterium]|nr:flagellar protein export ATPase FliI, fliI [Chlamydiales bacterium]
MTAVAEPKHLKAASKLRSVLKAYEEAEDLINIGAYVSGANPKIDEAVQLMEAVRSFLQQPSTDALPYEETIQALIQAVRL